MGDLSRIRGKAYEQALLLLHTRYEAAGSATVWQQGTVCIPYKTRGGKMRWRPIKSLPDFAGVSRLEPGRSIAFDAKFTLKDRYSHPKSRAHQCQHLWKVRRAGGLAFILVGTESGNYAIRPERHWQDEKGWSKHFSQMTPVPDHPDFPNDRIPDWLAVMACR